MSSRDIYRFLQIDERLATAGQPTEEQIRSAAAEGFEAVINLAPAEPVRTLANEAGVVKQAGMAYYHIPVEWENPLVSDFVAFEKIFQQVEGKKTLIHCVANLRVSAFYSLYALKHLDWTEEQAAQFRLRMWQGKDNPIWDEFIRQMTDNILQTK